MEPEVYTRHLENEESHWWFRGRREIIRSVVKKNFSNGDKKINILDFGAGSGTNIQMLNSFGNVYVYEKNKKISDFLKEKFKSSENIKIVEDFNNKDFFDLIVVADVIEHIKEDKLVLNQLSNSLKKNGKLLLTAPAYQFLFSNKDVTLHHYRRYTKTSLNKLFEENYTILKSSYFNFFLFLPLCILILIMKILKIQFIDSVEKKPNFLVNTFLYLIFFSESILLKFINLPFGISILTFCEKKNQ
tara:strand:- start:397 stop:1131 length:735 start_codon:yes stop_codon:yes gene_type:complete